MSSFFVMFSRTLDTSFGRIINLTLLSTTQHMNFHMLQHWQSTMWSLKYFQLMTIFWFLRKRSGKSHCRDASKSNNSYVEYYDTSWYRQNLMPATCLVVVLNIQILKCSTFLHCVWFESSWEIEGRVQKSPPTEFVGFRSNMYAFKVGRIESKGDGGVKKYTVKY